MLRYRAGCATTCLRSRPARLAFLLTAISLLTLGCAPRASWEEEVSIAPGETVIVEREARFRSSGAVGSPKFTYPTKQSLRVRLASGPTGEWVSALTNRFIPKSTLKPLYLHQDDDGQLILVTTFEFCANWRDFKRPASPYVGFRWTGKRTGIPSPYRPPSWSDSANLLIDPGPDTEQRLTVAEACHAEQSGHGSSTPPCGDVPYVPNCADPPTDIQRPEAVN